MSQVSEIPNASPFLEASTFVVDGIEPKGVVEPHTTEEIGDVLKLAGDRSWGVIPFGSGSRQGVGNLPTRFDVALSLRSFNRIPEYEPQDLVVKVECGCRLSDLQQRLARDNLFLPIDPPNDGCGTVGGIVASNASGPLRFAHGTIRDLLLGVSVVQPAGFKTKFGARVVKNVTGYDMCKLYAGSFGTLGVLTDFYLKLKPMPSCQTTVMGFMKKVSDTTEAVTLLRESPLSPLAVEFLNSQALRALSQTVPSFEHPEGYALVVLFGEVENAVKWQVAELKRLWGSLAITEMILDDSAGQKALWEALREDMPFTKGRGSAVKLKINSLPNQLRDLVQQLDLPRNDASIKSHAAGGVTQAYLSFPDSAAEQEEIVRGILRLRSFLRPVRGSVVVELAPPALKKMIDAWGHDSKDRLLMQRIREKYDPHGVLNPGRFVV